jgi:hypothetical protein
MTLFLIYFNFVFLFLAYCVVTKPNISQKRCEILVIFESNSRVNRKRFCCLSSLRQPAYIEGIALSLGERVETVWLYTACHGHWMEFDIHEIDIQQDISIFSTLIFKPFPSHKKQI